MESHSEGEAWGLTSVGGMKVATSGDDNKIKVWDISARSCIATGIVSDKDAKSKKGGASTLSDLAPSKCARALAFNPTNGHLAVGANDGTVSIREATNPGKALFTLADSAEWIEIMEYSPDGSKLAVGSHDNSIYFYDSSSYSKLGVMSKHSSYITSIDWSKDGTYLRSVCGAYDLLFTKTDTYEQDPSGATNTKSLDWHTGNAKFFWNVEGIFPSGTDGTHINGVDISKDGSLVATGDDFGLVNVFRNPCRANHKPISLRGHSEHVVKVRFVENDAYLFSIGGYDQTVMQWRRK